MVIAYINKTIPVPNVDDIQTTRDIQGATETTKGGKLLRWSLGIKRTYEISAEELTNEEYEAIVSHIESINGTQTLFWLRRYGGDPEISSRTALIDITDDQEVSFWRDGTWHCDGHNIRLSVQEVG